VVSILGSFYSSEDSHQLIPQRRIFDWDDNLSCAEASVTIAIHPSAFHFHAPSSAIGTRFDALGHALSDSLDHSRRGNVTRSGLCAHFDSFPAFGSMKPLQEQNLNFDGSTIYAQSFAFAM
jgi:hypothetical protein